MEIPEETDRPSKEEKPQKEELSARRRRGSRGRRASRRGRGSGRHSGRIGGLGGRRKSLGEAFPPESRIGFGRRLLGLLIDAFICVAAGTLLAVVLMIFHTKPTSEMLWRGYAAKETPADVEEEPPPTQAAQAPEAAGDVLPDEEGRAEPVRRQRRPGEVFDSVLGKILGIVLGIVMVLPFYGFVEAMTGASPGKKMLGIRIRNKDGRLVQGHRLLARYLMKYGVGVLGVLSVLATLGIGRALGDIIAILGCLMGLAFIAGSFGALSAHRQGLHDELLDTAVYPVELPEPAEG